VKRSLTRSSKKCKDCWTTTAFEDLLVEKANDEPPLNIDLEAMLGKYHSIGVKNVLSIEENTKVYLVGGVATKVLSCGEAVDMSLSVESNMESCIVKIAKKINQLEDVEQEENLQVESISNVFSLEDGYKSMNGGFWEADIFEFGFEQVLSCGKVMISLSLAMEKTFFDFGEGRVDDPMIVEDKPHFWEEFVQQD